MKKPSSGGIKNILIGCGIGTGILMLIFCTASTIMIQSALKKFKHKMEEAGAGIETIVDKFKKAGEKYNEEIDNLKKEVAALKDGSSSKPDEKPHKKDPKKGDEKDIKKSEKSEKSEKVDKPDDKKDDKSDSKESKKAEKSDSKDEITFKDDKDVKKDGDL